MEFLSVAFSSTSRLLSNPALARLVEQHEQIQRIKHQVLLAWGSAVMAVTFFIAYGSDNAGSSFGAGLASVLLLLSTSSGLNMAVGRITPIRKSPAACEKALKLVRGPGPARDYRDEVVRQGRELCVLDLEHMKRLDEKSGSNATAAALRKQWATKDAREVEQAFEHAMRRAPLKTLTTFALGVSVGLVLLALPLYQGLLDLRQYLGLSLPFGCLPAFIRHITYLDHCDTFRPVWALFDASSVVPLRVDLQIERLEETGGPGWAYLVAKRDAGKSLVCGDVSHAIKLDKEAAEKEACRQVHGLS